MVGEVLREGALKGRGRRKASTISAPRSAIRAATSGAPSIAPRRGAGGVHRPADVRQRHSAAESSAARGRSGRSRAVEIHRTTRRSPSAIRTSSPRPTSDRGRGSGGPRGGAPGRPVVGKFPRRRRDALPACAASGGRRRSSARPLNTYDTTLHSHSWANWHSRSNWWRISSCCRLRPLARRRRACRASASQSSTERHCGHDWCERGSPPTSRLSASPPPTARGPARVGREPLRQAGHVRHHRALAACRAVGRRALSRSSTCEPAGDARRAAAGRRPPPAAAPKSPPAPSPRARASRATTPAGP